MRLSGRSLAFLLLSLSSAFSYRCFPQTSTPSALSPSANESPSESAFTPRQLLRDLNEHGISPQAVVIYDWSKTLHAKQDSGNGFGRYSFDLLVPVDGKKLFGLSGSAGMARLKHHINVFGETYDGAAQLYSNIDASSRTTLYEIWFEQRLMSDRIRIKAGKIDANTEFAVVQNAGNFLNSSMGYSPTIVTFPTYPEPKPGVSAFVNAGASYGLGLGVFKTAGSNTLSIVEPGRSWNIGKLDHPGRISFGYWRLDGRISRFDDSQSSGAHGFYSVVEQSVLRQPLAQDRGKRRVSTFLQLGWAEGRVSGFTHHIGGGAILQGPLQRRSQDSLGLAATWVRFSSEPQAGFGLRSEFVVETYYKIPFNKHVALVQDFQFLHHPGGLRTNGDCPVITPRLVISF